MWKTPSSPSPQKSRVYGSQKKQIFIVFYDTAGVILCHGVLAGMTLNSEYYQKVNKGKYHSKSFFEFSKLSAFMLEYKIIVSALGVEALLHPSTITPVSSTGKLDNVTMEGWSTQTRDT